MSDVVDPRCRLFWRLGRTGTFLLLGLLNFGCGPTASTKNSTAKSEAAAEQEAEARTLRNLQNALAGLQPEKFTVSSNPEQTIAVLNEWAKGAKRAAEKSGAGWEPTRPHGLLKSLPKEWIEQIGMEQFVERDAPFLRDCLWASKASRFGAREAQADLDIVVQLFEYVVRNVDLIADASRQVPLGLFDVMMTGRGTAKERAWVFGELLRQRNIDAVILTPRRAARDAGGEDHLLVGVLFEKDILLFDPTLGIPLPADQADPKSAFPRRPMTLRQAGRDPELLAGIARDSGGRFTLTAEMLASPQVELICHSEQLSSRMRHLQQELTGDQSAVVADPLEDFPEQPGLWSRVAKHPAATWSADDVAIWSYPEAMREASTHLTPEQTKELAKATMSLAAPIRLVQVQGDEVDDKMKLIFGKPERALLKLRIQHVLGQWPEAMRGYLAVQLYDVEPPTAKELDRLNSKGKKIDQFSIASTLDKQNLRLLMMQPDHAHVRRLHLLAGDDACFWVAQCQFEQDRLGAVVSQCRVYDNQHSSGGWVSANQLLIATTLAKQAKLKEAVRVLNAFEENIPAFGGTRVLMARWQRLLESAE